MVRWALATGTNFRTGALNAVHVGGDADVIGAVYGQLAGALYGQAGIPASWLERLAQRALIEDCRAPAGGGAGRPGFSGQRSDYWLESGDALEPRQSALPARRARAPDILGTPER